MYKGNYVYTIQPSDVGKRALNLNDRFTVVSDFIGIVQPCDVGKQIWEHRGIYSIENQEQVDARMMAKEK